MKNLKWILLITLSLTWGSSFILIKKALLGLNPFEIGAFRILFAAIILVAVGFKKLKNIEISFWKPLIITGFCGTFFPVFLFSFAITEIDSAIAAVLNSLTPLITMLLGVLFFKFSFSRKQLFGVLIGLGGTLILLYNSALENPTKNYSYALLILIATVGYAYTTNHIKTYLAKLDAVSITVASFSVLIPPTLIILHFSGFFDRNLNDPALHTALSYVFILAALGTSIAMLLFNKLIQISSPVFSTSVSYLITVVAVIWGVVDSEKITLIQCLAAILIVYGVIIAQKRKSLESSTETE